MLYLFIRASVHLRLETVCLQHRVIHPTLVNLL